MRQTIILITLFAFTALLVSCSGTAEVADDQQDTEVEEKSAYPSWYPQQEFISEETQLLAYAAAIDADSTSAIEKAKGWAKEGLKSSISDKLEELRSEAASENSGSGLDEAKFLMALRKAPRAADDLIEIEKTEVMDVENYESVRGFVEISVPKDQLIERIGKRLGGYEQPWNAMKESEAFDDF
ncbi:MAG: hypothetical protein ACQEST_05435 [Bacteroidota bacterium]